MSDDDDTNGNGVGFSFSEYHADALMEALERAVRAYADGPRWKGIVDRCMRREHSWGVSARRYLELYRGAQQCCS